MTTPWPSLAVHVVGWTLLDTSLVFVLLFPAYLVSLIVCGRHSSTTRYAAGCTMLILVLLGTLGSLARQIINRPTPTELIGADLGVPVRSTSLRPLRPINEPGVARAPLFPHETPPSWLDRLSEQVEPVLPYALAVWLGGVLILTGQNATGLVRIARITRRGRPAEGSDVDRWSSLACKLGITRTVHYLATNDLLVPATVGWLKPVVLYPVCLTTHFGMNEIDAMIAHELAHVRRWDYPFTVLLAVLTTVLFFHPCLWVVTAQLRRDREIGCDAAAGHVCGSPKLVAACLVKMAELVTLAHGPTLAMGFGGSGLLHRVLALRTERALPVNWPALAMTFAIVLGCTLALSGQVIARADAVRERDILAREHESVFVFNLLNVKPARPAFKHRLIGALQAAHEGAKGDDPRFTDLITECSHGADPAIIWNDYVAMFAPSSFPTVDGEYSTRWLYFDPPTQRRLAWTLSNMAKIMPRGPKQVATARASLLMASLKRECTGIAMLRKIVFDHPFCDAAGLTPVELDKLREFTIVSADGIGNSHDALQAWVLAADAKPEIDDDLISKVFACGDRLPEFDYVVAAKVALSAHTTKESKKWLSRHMENDAFMRQLLQASDQLSTSWQLFDVIDHQ